MYRSYYRPMRSTRSRQPRPESQVLTAEQIWGAAARADRVNGGEYRKEPEYRVLASGTVTPEVVRQPNKNLLWEAIQDNSLITDADIETGRASRDWLRKTLVFRRLKGDLSEFDQALATMVDMDEFITGTDRYEIAIVTSQIRAAREGQRMETVMSDVDTRPVAPVGDKVTLSVEVVKSVYSANYNVYFITAKTQSNQMVFFSYREAQKIGAQLEIRGTVKAHRPDATQLNRVRVVA